jgi:peroxiredoxin
MLRIDWQVAAAIATVVSTLAFIASAIVVILQLRQAARERYFTITAHLFEIWQSTEFQHDQLFLLHMLSCASWDDFCRLGRGERAERAIHRVGGYYDRVGNLVRHDLIDKQDILPTIGGYAVAVWHRIEPLVKELRLRENAVLFQNYESLLPDCHECYVPGIAPLKAPSTAASASPQAQLRMLEDAAAFESRLGGDDNAPVLKPAGSTDGITIGSNIEMANEHPGSAVRAQVVPDLTLKDTDGIARALSEFTGSGPAVLVYARGAWCPFCLRQLSDYAERYSDFKRSGVEVVALSPESPRKARRMRTGLKLPFTVLSDTHYVAAQTFGLMGHEKPGMPTPATLVLDAQRSVRLSTLNQAQKCLFARDVLDYTRALKQLDISSTVSGPAASIPIPQVGPPRPGFLFARALANMAVGLISR